MLRAFLRKIFCILALFGVFFSTALPTYAVSVPSIGSILKAVEKRYHINPGSVQDAAEGFNVSEQKTNAPEVILNFTPSNPKPGEEVTAQASTLYFKNAEEDLYFTWYITHSDTDIDTPTDNEVEGWKREAAYILANDGYNTDLADYSSDDDDDGYEASFGGDGLSHYKKYCYVQDFTSGGIYELVESSSGALAGGSMNCPNGQTALCVDSMSVVCPSSFSASASGGGSASVSGETFGEYSRCYDTGVTPECVDGQPECAGDGTPWCVPDSVSLTTDACSNNACSSLGGSQITTCSTNAVGSSSTSGYNSCKHLFPNPDGIVGTVGDGSFGRSEEEYWGTNPHDPDTANTGFSDEANIVGLGQNSFTWVYQAGDKVGVAVEGLSYHSTKHDDRSNAIMWALPNNKCEVQNKNVYYEKIRGYDVDFKTATMDIDDCLKDNLVDPRESRQAADLDVRLSYLPDTPFNDATGAGFGDTLYVTANVGNSTTRDEFLHFNWRVEASNGGTYNPRDFDGDNPNAGWTDITSYLIDNDLISHTEGNGLTSLQIKLNILEDAYLSADGGVFRVTAEVTENVGGVGINIDSAGNAIRQDRGQVIVEVTSTEQRITPYMVSIQGGSRVALNTGAGTICEEENSIEKALCFVARGEIVGIRFDGEGVEDYAWKLNNSPLVCDSSISSECSDTRATDTNFFPVTGNPGDTYTITMSGTDVDTGKTLEIERVFQVVDPFIKIVSEDRNTVWPIYMGTLTNDEGQSFDNFSDVAFEVYPGGSISMYAEFHPGFIESDSDIQWSLDGSPLILEESPNRISFTADGKQVGDFYTIKVAGLYRQSSEARNAIKKLWDVSMIDIPDEYLSKSVTVRLVSPEGELALDTPKGLFAAAISNASRQALYLFQLLGSIAVIVFLMGIAYSFSRQEE